MRTPCAILLAVALSPADEALADCALPPAYDLLPDSSGDLQVRLLYTPRKCPDEGLLRLDVTSGDIVMITACVGEDFLDECVPAGIYRYGLAAPFDCAGGVCFAPYYGTYESPGPSESCKRGGPLPTPAQSVPWGSQPYVCTYRSSSGGCGVDPRGAVLGTNLLLGLVGLALWRWRPGRRPRA